MHFNKLNEQIAISSFRSEAGCCETCIVITPNVFRAQFSDFLLEISRCIDVAVEQAGVSLASLVFSRLYLSDIENQKTEVQKSPLYEQLAGAAFSVIGQPPLTGGSSCLLLYFTEGLVARKLDRIRKADGNGEDTWGNTWVFRGQHYSLLWGANYTAADKCDSEDATRRLFEQLNHELEMNHMSTQHDLLRTWVYVRDVDNRYRGMVDARRAFFEQHGLTADFRFPASTGIEGQAHTVSCLVDMDALAYNKLAAEQIIRMEALEYLNPTIDYGVTFDRGIRIRFGDRSHMYISGTASINKCGDIQHPGDVLKQTERTVVNMSALLEKQGATLRDMAYIILYLRDTVAWSAVKEHLHTLVPAEIPIIPVSAAVCRPGWLIEMEGVAIVRDNAPFPKFL
jgi:enamine deaminase RidA (YjgF/YER057c/UK114 family)